MKDDLPPRILLVLVLFIVSILGIKINSSETIIEERLVIVNGSYLEAIVPPVTFENQVLGNIVNCMAFYESSNNPEALNPEDPITRSVGLLQFKDQTFKEQCVETYGCDDDIWNPTVQRECALKMLADEKGYHWSTFKRCN